MSWYAQINPENGISSLPHASEKGFQWYKFWNLNFPPNNITLHFGDISWDMWFLSLGSTYHPNNWARQTSAIAGQPVFLAFHDLPKLLLVNFFVEDRSQNSTIFSLHLFHLAYINTPWMWCESSLTDLMRLVEDDPLPTDAQQLDVLCWNGRRK